MLPQNLDPVAVRVLASLVEKELSTPDHYPLSLNAVTSACNQSSNRDPVMALDEGAVSRALDGLRRLGLVRSFQGIGSRVPKFQHLLDEAAELSRAELAVLCVLALRGRQTLAEIRSRTARLTAESSPEEVEAALESMMARQPGPAIARLPRRLGQKEVRYAHLLSGEAHDDVDEGPSPAAPPAAPTERIAALEELTRELRDEVADLRSQLEAFRKQFE